MPKAEKILDVRNEFQNGTVIVIRVWLVPEPVPPSEHRFKYSFFFGRPSERSVCVNSNRSEVLRIQSVPPSGRPRSRLVWIAASAANRTADNLKEIMNDHSHVAIPSSVVNAAQTSSRDAGTVTSKRSAF